MNTNLVLFKYLIRARVEAQHLRLAQDNINDKNKSYEQGRLAEAQYLHSILQDAYKCITE